MAQTRRAEPGELARSTRARLTEMLAQGTTTVEAKSGYGLSFEDELKQLGFHLILYPLAGLFAAAAALERVYTTLYERHTTLGTDQPLMDFSQFNRLIGVEEKYTLAARYGVEG